MNTIKTQWSEKVMESFVSNTSTTGETIADSVSETTTSPPIVINQTATNEGKNADEMILMDDVRTDSNVEVERKKSEPEPEPPSIYNQIKEFFKAPNWTKFAEMYKNAIVRLFSPNKTAADGDNYPWRRFVEPILPMFWIDPESEEGRKYAKMMAGQINTWYLLIPITYLIVINWWYFWNYTTFSIDFRGFIPPVFGWIFEPLFYSMEFINYYIIGIRVDANPNFAYMDPTTIRQGFRLLWDNRPVTFTFFYACIAGLFGTWMTGISEFMAAVLLGNPTLLSIMIPLLAVGYFIKNTFNSQRWLKYNTYFTFPPFILACIIIILTFILSIVFAGGFGPAVITMYFYFISFFAIVIFSFPGLSPSLIMWPWTIIREYFRIYHDLSEAPVSNPETKNVFEMIGNFLFQECHNLFIFFVVCLSVLMRNIMEIVRIISPTRPLLQMFILFINFLCVLVVSGGMKITLGKLYRLFVKIMNSFDMFSNDLPTSGIKE